MASVAPIPRLARTQAEPLLATIGNTPLLRLEKIPREFPGIEIFGKAEYFNPGGSVKDRAALNMILDGERSGKLNHRRVILDATSGNTGIAYAMIAANRGYKVKLCLPANASIERKRILKAYGAEVVFSAAAEASDGAIRLCRQIYMADPDSYFYPDQYNNPANWKAHYEHTGPEILKQTAGRHSTSWGTPSLAGGGGPVENIMPLCASMASGSANSKPSSRASPSSARLKSFAASCGPSPAN